MTRRNTFFGIWLFFSMLIGITGVVPSAQAQPETLTIAAANSLKDALRKVLPRFEAEHPAINVRVIYGPSQSLRKQIEEGAPVDIFLPSLFDEIDQLETKGLIIQGTKRAFAGTSLVLITGAALPAPVRTIHDLETVPVRRIAIGDPKTSSVGKVAAQFLKYVAKGEAEVGVVYRTDAASNDKVRILDTAPVESHTPVRYGVAAVWTAKNVSGAGDFIEFLLAPQTQALFQEYGFDRVTGDVGLVQRQEVKP